MVDQPLTLCTGPELGLPPAGAVVVALIIIGVVVYLISRAEASNSSGEILLYHEYARLQLEALPILL